MKKSILLIILSCCLFFIVGCKNMVDEENFSSDELSSEFRIKAQPTNARLYMWWLDERLRNCFVKDTEIKTTNGTKSIQDFIVGDYVLSEDMKKSFYVYGVTSDSVDDDVVKITYKDNALKVTKVHPIVVLRNGEVTVTKAESVLSTDKVYFNQEWVLPEIELIPYKGMVYNLVLWSDDDELVKSNQLYARTLYAEGFLTADLTVQELLR